MICIERLPRYREGLEKAGEEAEWGCEARAGASEEHQGGRAVVVGGGSVVGVAVIGLERDLTRKDVLVST